MNACIDEAKYYCDPNAPVLIEDEVDEVAEKYEEEEVVHKKDKKQERDIKTWTALVETLREAVHKALVNIEYHYAADYVHWQVRRQLLDEGQFRSHSRPFFLELSKLADMLRDDPVIQKLNKEEEEERAALVKLAYKLTPDELLAVIPKRVEIMNAKREYFHKQQKGNYDLAEKQFFPFSLPTLIETTMPDLARERRWILADFPPRAKTEKQMTQYLIDRPKKDIAIQEYNKLVTFHSHKLRYKDMQEKYGITDRERNAFKRNYKITKQSKKRQEKSSKQEKKEKKSGKEEKKKKEKEAKVDKVAEDDEEPVSIKRKPRKARELGEVAEKEEEEEEEEPVTIKRRPRKTRELGETE